MWMQNWLSFFLELLGGKSDFNFRSFQKKKKFQTCHREVHKQQWFHPLHPELILSRWHKATKQNRTWKSQASDFYDTLNAGLTDENTGIDFIELKVSTSRTMFSAFFRLGSSENL